MNKSYREVLLSNVFIFFSCVSNKLLYFDSIFVCVSESAK